MTTDPITTAYEPNPDDVSIEFLTPENARDYLEANLNNRWPKHRKISSFIRDMQRGAWRWNGETIKFDVDGNLIDGQNRLMALAQSDIEGAWFLVVYNVESEARSTIDTGTARTFGDTLKMQGYSDAALLAGSTRLMWVWDSGFRIFKSGSITPTIAELSATLEKHPALVDFAKAGRILTQHTVLTPSISGFVLYVLNQISPEDAEYFFDKLRYGTELPEDSPIYQLREALDRLHRRTQGRGSYLTDVQIALVFKAWNRYRDGQPVSLLRFSPGGANPEEFPEPH